LAKTYKFLKFKGGESLWKRNSFLLIWRYLC
jgi:hypothetical protein